jgi:hypothetical protein
MAIRRSGQNLDMSVPKSIISRLSRSHKIPRITSSAPTTMGPRENLDLDSMKPSLPETTFEHPRRRDAIPR